MQLPVPASVLALGTSILIGLVGQVLLKAGALQMGGSAGVLAVDARILAGLGAYLVSAMLYIYALRSIPLSIAFPSISLAYVGVAFVSHWLWKEPFGVQQLFGLALITAGIYVLAQPQGVAQA